MLADYKKALSKSFVLQDLKKYKRFPAFVSSHNQIFSLFPEILNEAAGEFLTVDNVPKTKKQRRIIRRIRSRISIWQLIKDFFAGWRAVK